MKDFKAILENIGKDILNDETKSAIVESFEAAVNEKVETRVKMEVEAAQTKIDEQHGAMLEKLLESIDADHTNKLKKVLLKVDSDYAEKLQNVVEKYEKMLKEEAVEFRDQLVSEMSNFLDLYLDQVIPVEQIQEAVENTKAKRIVESMKKLVAVDESFITDNIREALADGKDQIETLREELHEAMKANIQLNQAYKKTSAEKLLIEKTLSFDDAKKDYVMRVLAEKSPDEIEQNFDYVVEMAERDEADKVQVIKESVKDQRKSKNVDVPKTEEPEHIIEESVSSGVDSYLTELQNLK